MRQWISTFAEGSADQRQRLGGKGAGLAEMVRAGLPVPPGFTITTDACRAFLRHQDLPPGLEAEIADALSGLEQESGRRFGDAANPLLVSVRSGAAVSMPGMMDTVLNLGLNAECAAGLAAQSGDPRFAWDAYRRFIQMYANVVAQLPLERFEARLEKARQEAGVREDRLIPAAILRAVVEDHLKLYAELAKSPFPTDPRQQLESAVRAVFSSWKNPRAEVYRRVHNIPEDMGTAVTVQAMVFGNRGDGSATGVLFTRNPNTGERILTGEYLPNAQGEDVVAGIRTPLAIAKLQEAMPGCYRQIAEVSELLERHYQDMQDIEFTIEEGRVFLLQTRSAKRSARAGVKTAVDMAKEGLIEERAAVGRVTPEEVAGLLHRTLDPEAEHDLLAEGLPASPGAAVGTIVFDAERASEQGRSGQSVILVRPETAPDDVHGIVEAAGVLTSRGGMTCHAAIVARGMGKPCIVGCEALRIDLAQRTLTVAGRTLAEGDLITLDGSSGKVYVGQVATQEPDLGPEVGVLLGWADQIRKLGVRANADTPEDAVRARELGAEGVGLCRTEHMFMAKDRLPVVRRMIMAETVEERRAALSELLPMQQQDFEGILRAMAPYPVTIRLLDPPLHEFLPHISELEVEVAVARERGEEGSAGYRQAAGLLRRAKVLAEANPMLGFRGCRLGIVYPEIYEMQARAIFQAVAALRQEGVMAEAEVMIPLVGMRQELAMMRQLVAEVHAEVALESQVTMPLVVGTMIEVPRAALTAGEIAEEAQFFSFGTNDLTQTTFGFSRDDAEGKFLPAYLERGVLADNPFATLDRDGVGALMKMATEEGRRRQSKLKVGICGEHGGDPRSIALCQELGLNYVSCSPYRVPVARLAAAHAAMAAAEVA
ncbi:MAG: pyruvate, phosphate dikinase [Sulfobacillus sp.]